MHTVRSSSVSGLLLVACLLGCSSDGGATDDDGSDARVVGQGGGKDAARPGTDGGASRDDDAAEDDDDDDDDALDAGSSMQPRTDARVATDAGSAADATARDAASAVDAGKLERFSFFMTSLRAMRDLSGNENGFGGDLRHGETGDGAGLRGADKICSEIAESSMPGSSAKQWRAFLSATKGGANNGAVHAIDRIGSGPWYDRLGRLVGMTKADLLQVRPNADSAIKNDLPNEEGVPNHNPEGTGQVDNHHVLTGSSAQGQLYKNDVKVTCNDWTKSARDQADAPRTGLSWPRGGGGGGGGAGSQQWISALDESGCAPGVSLNGQGGPVESDPTVGSGGGYGAIYCFALQP